MMRYGSSGQNHGTEDKQAQALILEEQMPNPVQDNAPNHEDLTQNKAEDKTPEINQDLQKKAPELIVLSDDEEEEKAPQSATTQVAAAQLGEAAWAIEQASASLLDLQTHVQQEENMWCCFDQKGNYPQAATSQVAAAQLDEAAQVIDQASASLLALQSYDLREEVVWCYLDPEGNVQGPLSLYTLKLWRDAGFYPSNLMVWKLNRLETAVHLTDLLYKWFGVY